jgi:radical SAM-linked protein
MRLFERALRRAQLPVAMSEGFNPRPRMSFPMALGVGISGSNEVADVALSEWVRPDDVRARLQAQLPDGIGVLSAEVIPSNASRQPVELVYRAPLLPGHSVTEDAIRALLAREGLTACRESKEGPKQVDIRPFVKALRLEDGALLILLRYTERGTARPQEVLGALGCREGLDYLASDIERTHVRLPSLA